MKNLIAAVTILLATLVAPPAFAAFRCTPGFPTNAPEESQLVIISASKPRQADAIQALDGVVSQVKALYYPTSSADAVASVKCIANELVAVAHGSDNVVMLSNLKAWLSLH